MLTVLINAYQAESLILLGNMWHIITPVYSNQVIASLFSHFCYNSQ